MADRSVAIRLATDGSAQVKADFSAIAESGDASAKRIVSAYDKASDDVQAAMDRQARAAQRVQAVIPSQVQATVNRSVGTGYDGSQNASAAQYAALLAQQERQVQAVRAAIDPLYASQQRYDREIATAGGLLKQGAISETEHAAAVAVAGRALRDAENALEGHTSALGLNRQQTIIAQSAVLRFTDAIISGRNPLTAFALEAHKGVEVLSTDDDGMAGGLAKVSGLINPVSIGITALAAVVAIGTAAWAGYTDEMAKLDTVASVAGAAIGATGQQLEANAEAAAAAGVLTVGAAQKIESGYVTMGGIGADVLTGLTKLTADYAAATGESVDQAQAALGKMFQDPIKGAEDLASRYGVLSQAQVEQIRQIEEENGLYAAQAKLLDDLGPAFDGAAHHAEGLKASFDEIKSSISEAWAKLGGFLTGINDATPAAARLQKALSDRAALGNSFAPGLRANLDAQIADARAEMTRAQANANAQSNKFAQDALGAGSGYTGYDQKRQLEEARDKLQRGLSDPKTVEQYRATGQLDEQRAALEAYTRAVDTYLGPAEKKRQLDLADVAIAQARAKRDPAAVAAAAARREEIEQKGVVATQADVEADALAKGERARARLDGAAGKRAETLAREAAAMEETTAAARAAAAAYLTEGAAAGQEADARGKATSAATKSGAEIDAQVRRQLAQSVAEGNETGAKAVSQLRIETAARSEVDEAVRKGALTVDQMGHALSDEQALRELTIKQSLAYRLGLTADYKAITETIEAYRKALGEAHAEESESGSIRALDDIRKRVEDALLSGRYAGDHSGAYERAKSALDANRAADANQDLPDQRAARVTGSVAATSDEQDAKRKAFAEDAVRASNVNVAINQAQVGAIGKTADAQQLIVERLRLQQSLAISLGDEYEKYAPAILAAAGAADESDLHLKHVQDTMSAVREQGDKFIDDLFNPKGGDGLKSLLKDAKQELEQMALINPLKNLLGGPQLPTLSGLLGGGGGTRGSSGGGLAGGIGGLLHKFLGGGAKLGSLSEPDLNIAGAVPTTIASSGFDFSSLLTHFAAGTDYSQAGPAWVGENGPEIVDLPQGSKVTNASDTRRMMAAANDSGDTHNHFHLEHAVVTQDLLDQMNAIGNRSAQQGAAGGAQQATRAAAISKRRSFSQG